MTVHPLEGLDGAFLALEGPTSHLHIAAVLVLDPPEGKRSLFSPSTRFAQIRRVVEQRLPLVAPLRQRAVRVPFGLGYPVWADDPDFDLDDHIRRASLPAPGGQCELEELVADVLSRPLDLEHPLWEMVVVEGLADDRTALIAKLHHAIVDGVSGASLLAAFFDLGPRGRPVEFARERWDPEPIPSSASMLRYGVSTLARQPELAVGAVQRGIETVLDVASQNRLLAKEGTVPPPAPFSAPRTSLNGTLSSKRRFTGTQVALEELKLVRRSFATTVNDVILAAVSGALRRLLYGRGESLDESLIAMIPVSTRDAGGDDSLGNKISAMLVSLATDIDDPVDRLLAIASGSRIAKSQDRLTGGHLLEDVARATIPAVTSRAARWAAGWRIFDRVRPPFNVTVSSILAPDATLWCAGSRVVALQPVGPVAEGVGLNVTAMTYKNQVHFGILGCRRLVPDIADLPGLLDESLFELVRAAAEAQGLAG